MNTAQIRFYADLSFFLPHGTSRSLVTYSFRGEPAIKDSIEAIGVPHPEVELILVDGAAVHFEYRLRDGDRVSVFPHFRNLTPGEGMILRGPPPEPVRFVLDIHLGRLADYLRLLGFDSLYQNTYEDRELARIASSEGRVLLSRDRGLLKRSEVLWGYCLRSSQPREQVLEVFLRYRLKQAVQPFARCMRCNGRLEPVRKEVVLDKLPLSVQNEQDEFRRCQECGQVYWRGSHFERLSAFVEGLLSAPGLD